MKDSIESDPSLIDSALKLMLPHVWPANLRCQVKEVGLERIGRYE